MEKKSSRINKSFVKNFFIILLTFFLSSFFTESYALPFTIVPNGALPTSVPAGGSVIASYAVINNTVSYRNSNFVKYLPPNVSIAGGGCANNFNLAPKGQAGDSCTLNLNVLGAVNAADPDPHHHLFVCFPGGITCAGTNFPLNVSVISAPTQFTITPIAGAGGTIIPSTPQVVNSGASVTFTAKPATGFFIKQWLLDGVVVQTGGTTFTLSNINANHTVQVTFAPVMPVTVGESFDSSFTTFLPVAYTSSNGGSSWMLSSPLALPAGQTQGFLSSVSCVGGTCTTVGSSSFTSDLPLAYTSSDSGSHWMLSSGLSLPVGQELGFLNSVSCVGSSCTTVGNSRNATNDTSPLAYTSSNSGSNWTLSSTLAIPPGRAEAFLNSVSCVGSSCTTVGSSTNLGNDNLPLAYTSSNSGSNWTLSSLPISLPPGKTQGLLNGVACVGSRCTAVGRSFSSNFDNVPSAYISSDGGMNWTLSPVFPLPVGSTQAILTGVTCVGSTCTAVGFGFDFTGTSFINFVPVAYKSSDGGINWTSSSAFPLPVGQTQGELFGVTCVGNACIASGFSFQNGGLNSLPLAYTSSDGGSTWILSSALPLPAGQTQGDLSGVSNGAGSGLRSSTLRKFGSANVKSHLPLRFQ